MKKWFLNLGLFILINFIFYFVIASIPAWRSNFKNDTTESNLLIIPKSSSPRQYPLLFMGTSHGRVFSRGSNHENVEEILGTKFINISKGAGHGGIVEEKIFLKYFYGNGNQVKTIFYFIDPYVLYSDLWNTKNYFAADEPLIIKFLIDTIESGVSKEVITNYLKSKLSRQWLTLTPTKALPNLNGYVEVTPEKIKKRIDGWYPDGLNQEKFKKYGVMLKDIDDLAKQHGSKIIYIIPPTLLGDLPGEKQLISLLSYLHLPYYDASNFIPENRWYYDLDHLNSGGIHLFTQDLLKPALDAERATIE